MSFLKQKKKKLWIYKNSEKRISLNFIHVWKIVSLCPNLYHFFKGDSNFDLKGYSLLNKTKNLKKSFSTSIFHHFFLKPFEKCFPQFKMGFPYLDMEFGTTRFPYAEMVFLLLKWLRFNIRNAETNIKNAPIQRLQFKRVKGVFWKIVKTKMS